VPGELVDDDAGHEPLGRDAALDQAFRRGRLDDRALAGPAGVFRAVRHDHPELGRDLVETLRALLPDDMHRAVAARAGGALGRERDMDAGKMCRQRATVRPSRPLRVSHLVRSLLLLLGRRILFGNRGLDIFERELHLVAIEPLRPLPELRTLQLLQEMTKLVVLFRQPAALLDQCIALTREPAHHSPQAIEIIGKRIDRHDGNEADSRSRRAHNMQPDSIRRRSHDVAVGRAISRACRRDQSIPSTSAAS
jgi:hypothetical protein